MRLNLPKPAGFHPNPVIKYCLAASFVLIVLMASISEYDRHPDEANHLSAAVYYKYHFLPPQIGDPSVRDSYSVWGVSYLNYHWAEYFFAGKFIFLISPILNDPYLAARFFNVSLFAFLAAFFSFQSRKGGAVLILGCFFLITPQVWYVFSYSNNDAFALFLAMLAAYQVVYAKSALRNFLKVEDFLSGLSGGILFGLLVGLLSVCKPNYWVYLGFIAIWILINFGVSAARLKKYAFIAFIATSVFAFRIGLDLYVNGETNFAGVSYIGYFFGGFEESRSKLAVYQDEVADYDLKPSTIESDLEKSRPEVKLRAKGVSIGEMFSKWHWHTATFLSFVGFYGYMNIEGPVWYYRSILLIFLLFGCYVATMVLIGRDKRIAVQFLITALFAFLTVLTSFFLSWNYAYQPQGRYLFPAIPMVAVFTYSNRGLLHYTVCNGFVLVTFLLSVYSFAFVALMRINEG